jgi:hypothetical protein
MEDNDNIVPEITAANPDGGAARLDADPVSDEVHQSLDSLLDDAEREENQETPTQTTSDEITTNQNIDDLVSVHQVRNLKVALAFKVAAINRNNHLLRKIKNDLRNLAAMILRVLIEALVFVGFAPVEADDIELRLCRSDYLGFRLFFKLGGDSFYAFRA